MATGYDTKCVVLLPTATIDTNGDWFMIGKFLSPTITVQGMTGADQISIRVSNNDKEDEPGPDDLGVPHGTLGALSADIGLGMGGSFTWCRVIYTADAAATGVTVKAQMQIAKIIAALLGVGCLLSSFWT